MLRLVDWKMATDFSEDKMPQFFRVNQPKMEILHPEKEDNMILCIFGNCLSADTVKRPRRLGYPMFCYSCAALTHRLKYINHK
jgi:hypothetical protein